MWKARLQEREGGPETTKEQEAERERQEPALSQQGTSGSEPEAAPEEEWSLASFLATKVKRGAFPRVSTPTLHGCCSPVTCTILTSEAVHMYE